MNLIPGEVRWSHTKHPCVHPDFSGKASMFSPCAGFWNETALFYLVY